MTKRITSDTENRILKAAEAVTDYVGDGMDPTEAVIKSARDAKLSSGHVRLVVQAYNTGASAGIYKAGASAAERARAVPLADADVALSILFPEKREIKIASATSYTFPKVAEFSKSQLTVDKSASIEKRTTKVPSLGEVLSAIKEASAELDRKWGRTLEPELKLEKAITDIENHFRTPGAVSFQHFKRACEIEYGQEASIILNALKIADHLKKRAGDTSVAWHLPPYRHVVTAIESGQKMASARLEATQFDAECGAQLIELAEFITPATKSSSLAIGLPVPQEVSIAEAYRIALREPKQAADEEAVEIPMSSGGLLKSLLSDSGDSTNKLKFKAMQKLTDPVHEGKLNVLRRRFMLTNLMANDPVIKSYNPEDVLHIYNQMTQLAPRASGQEMLVQAMLRRQLAQGQTDPHEVSQLSEIENRLKTIAEPSDSRRLPYMLNKITRE